MIINKQEILNNINALNDPNKHGKALGNLLGTTIAGGTLGAISGELYNNPFLGASLGASLGAGIGAIKSRKYFAESSQKTILNNKSIPCKGIKKKLGFSCKQDKNGFYIATHRARSKSYESLDKIPMKDITFVDSTG